MVEKIGPYRVYERLGVGGMGEVYKAYDDRLERWVAIKRIRPDREDAEDNRERFKREARATARLNHPSIVHLYGIFQEGDSDCIVMEYVEGETLDKRLAEGPLDPLEVATLGHEIASGLAEAHSNGILHRDLKAENIIITPKGRSKILDFGLAKPILSGELDPVLTGKGQLVGTSRAMSPEYVGGESIDHRSDLFSLGVLLYECLTGQSPFKAHNTLATLKQVMLHKQTPIRELNSSVPAELSKVVEELLEKEPADRPQSAQEVSLILGNLSGQMSSGVLDRPSASALLDSTASKFKAGVKAFSSSDTVLDLRPRRRWMTGLAVIAGLLVVAFFLGRLFNQEPEFEPLPEGQQIQVVLGDFKNQTGESVFDDSLQQAMRVDLEQSRFVQAMSQSRVRDTLARMQQPGDTEVSREIAVEIARREGAQRVVLGQIQQFGSTYSLLVQVVAPENDVTTFSASESARSQDGILSAMQKLTTAVRRHLGESADEISQSTTALEKVTTANFEALRAYTLGEQRMSAQMFDEAVPLFRRAIELDPSFGMAHAKLVVAFSNLGTTEKAIKAALEAQRFSERLTEEERFYVDGWVARWLGNPQDVIDVWSLFSDLHPENVVGHSNLAFSYWFYSNNFQAAAASFESAVRTAQTSRELSQAQTFLGYCRLALGHLSSAESSLTDGNGSLSNEAMEGLVLLRLAEGRFAEAMSQIESLKSQDDRARLEQVALTSRGLLEEALLSIRESQERWASAGSPPPLSLVTQTLVTEVALAVRLATPNDLRSVLRRLEEVARTSDPFSRTLTDGVGSMVAEVVKTLAREGFVDRASGLREMLRTPPPHTPSVTLSLIDIADAELAMAKGNLDGAGDFLKEALSHADTVTGHDSLAYLLRLRGDEAGALEQYSWIREHMGLAYVECFLSCSSVPNTILIWNDAVYKEGELSLAGSKDKASEALSLLVERLGESQLSEVEQARKWLDSLLD